MDDSIRNDLRQRYRQLAARYGWGLVRNEEEFLDRVLRELATLTATTPHREDQRRRLAILRTYSILLYLGIHGRQNGAAQELWHLLMRLAMRWGYGQAQAEELAQEAMLRIIKKLPDLRSPQSLTTWACKILRTVRNEGEKAPPLAGDEALEGISLPDDMATGVENGMLTTSLCQLICQELTNDLERVVLLRVILLEEQPRHVAHALGVPLARTRLAKSRALNRLRQNRAFIELLHARAGNHDLLSEQQRGERQ